MDDSVIVIAGATGDLGGRIARALVATGARVRAVVRKGATADKTAELRALGVTLAEADLRDVGEATRACAGASCVVSALAGLRDVIVDAQTVLLDGAVAAGVPRFIPSDYASDFTKMAAGSNRNFDLRRDFHGRLAERPIAATSIFNGAFADMLTGEAPLVLSGLRTVLYWHDADQLLDFTTKDDVATFTAAAALDGGSPRYLRIAGDEISARGLAAVAGDVTGKRFRLVRGGSLRTLSRLIDVTRALSPETPALYPPWQGMQYLRGMFDGTGKNAPLDNERYGATRWTKARDVLASVLGASRA